MKLMIEIKMNMYISNWRINNIRQYINILGCNQGVDTNKLLLYQINKLDYLLIYINELIVINIW